MFSGVSTSLAAAIMLPTNSFTPWDTSALISLESREIDAGGFKEISSTKVSSSTI